MPGHGHEVLLGPVEALTEVMAGRIDYYFLPLAPALANIRSGKVTALAVSSEKRAPTLPEVPTVGEIGLPGAVYLFWNGVFVPAKTPKQIVDALSAAMQKAMAAPGFKDKFRAAAVGMEPVASSPEEMLAIAKKDGEKTTKIIRDANIKID